MWDLGCELLAVAASLPLLPDRDLLDEAWARVAAVQHPSGAIPEQGSGTGHDSGRDFLSHYHPTLMAAFAATLTIGRLDDGARAGTHHRPGGQGVLG
ncbi:hypothetical protein STAFG_1681 [Streptomyces afghaniensis 772]|uniref:DUF6895 domain-containing protein n=2 Tax=Streptomyces TaxID=1883 RepID=S4MNW2_9ACTN|nr:hypothetical protein STAFG_1681 [Streptomyces afghaniensis 772]